MSAAADEVAAITIVTTTLRPLSCLRAFLDGARRWSSALRLARGVLEGEQELVSGRPVCVVEGVSCARLRRPPLRRSLRSRSWPARPASDRGAGRRPRRSRDEIERRLARRYLPAQLRYRAEHDPAARADVLLDNDRWDRPRALRSELGRFLTPPARRFWA